jgi:hypothetical protein
MITVVPIGSRRLACLHVTLARPFGVVSRRLLAPSSSRVVQMRVSCLFVLLALCVCGVAATSSSKVGTFDPMMVAVEAINPIMRVSELVPESIALIQHDAEVDDLLEGDAENEVEGLVDSDAETEAAADVDAEADADVDAEADTDADTDADAEHSTAVAWTSQIEGSGCGSGISSEFVSDWNMRSACAAHDSCYDRCGTTKPLCDSIFKRNMDNICMVKYVGTTLAKTTGKKVCLAQSFVYYQAVLRLGLVVYCGVVF